MTTKLVWLALLLLAPTAAAVGFPSEHVITYDEYIITTSPANGIIPETGVSINRPHAWQNLSGVSILNIRASYVTQSGGVSNPTADYAVLWDGIAVTDCIWHIQGGTLQGGRFNPAIVLWCKLDEYAAPGDHTIEIQRTAVTGTPVIASTISILLHQQETVTTMTTFEALTAFNAAEFAALLGLAIVGVILWSRSTDYAVRAFGAALPIIAGAIVILVSLAAGLGTLWAGAVGLGAILIVIGAYLQVRMGWDALTGGPV